MKTFIVSILLLLAIITVLIIHMNLVFVFAGEMLKLIDTTEHCVQQKDLTGAISYLSQANELIAKRKFWLSLAFDTNEIEELELYTIKLKKMLEFEKISDFYGELAVFRKVIDSFPYKEGINPEIIF